MKLTRYGLKHTMKMEAAYFSETLVPFTRLHGVISQNIALLLLTAFKISDFSVIGWISGSILGRVDPASYPTDIDKESAKYELILYTPFKVYVIILAALLIKEPITYLHLAPRLRML